MPAVDPEIVSIESTGVTLKRCMPFLDALNAGWILSLPAEVHFEISDDGQTVRDKHNMPFNLVESHVGYQTKGSHWGETPPLKFINPWTITTPAGWSTLFVPLLNREREYFEVASGLVDTDRYPHPVNFPFFMLPAARGKLFALKKGTPLVQMIPVRRDSFRADIRSATADEMLAADRTSLKMSAEPSWYRKRVRQR
jgi:hypothetical protein